MFVIKPSPAVLLWELNTACTQAGTHGVAPVAALLEAHHDLVRAEKHEAGLCIVQSAVKSRSIECVNLILRAGFAGRMGDRSLAIAVENGDQAIFEALLAAGEWRRQAKQLSRDGRPAPSPATVAAAYSGHAAMLMICIERDVNARAKYSPDHTLLHAAARHSSNAAAVEVLLSQGFDRAAVDDEGFTPAARACFACCDNLDVLLRDEPDPAAALRALYHFSEIDDGDANHFFSRVTCSVCTPPSPQQLRAVLHVCAVLRRGFSYFHRVRVHRVVAAMRNVHELIAVIRSARMDAVVQGHYIPDPLRTVESVALAAELDVCAAGAALQSAENTIPLAEVWSRAHVAGSSGTAPGSSSTLQWWAFARRRHVLRQRAAVLAAVRGH